MATAAKTLYGPASANRVLPLVRAIVRDVVRDFQHLRRLGLCQRAMASTADGRPAAESRRQEIDHGIQEVSGRLEGYLRELEDLGLEVRDIETGSVDFPTLVAGEPAFLCWRMGETEVRWWHRASSGFADRRPIAADAGVGGP